jgi:serine protease Do
VLSNFKLPALMKRIVIWALGCLLMAACGKSVEEKSHTVVNIIDGNTIQLKNGLQVELIGVEATPEGYEYLVNTLMNTKVRFYMDRSHQSKVRRSGQEVYAYIRTINGVSVNAELLKRRLAGLDTRYLTDSLTLFTGYASNEQPLVTVDDELPGKLSPKKKPVVKLPDSPRPAASPKSLRELVRMAEPAVFLIQTLDQSRNVIGTGTGFFINGQGVAVSNHHVFKGGKFWRIKTRDGKYHPVTSVISSDPDIDYLVFTVDIEQSPYLPLADELPEKGEDIFVLGNPKGLESTLTRGVVSAFRDIHTKNEFIQIDAAISSGSSGSPVMNMQGDVIGIATAKLDACENCNFAVNIQLVEKIFSR